MRKMNFVMETMSKFMDTLSHDCKDTHLSLLEESDEAKQGI
jgi:hypothetical protein